MNDMKRKFVIPEAELITFSDDVITTSTLTEALTGGDWPTSGDDNDEDW